MSAPRELHPSDEWLCAGRLLWLCVDCRVDTSAVTGICEGYMVRPDVWGATGMTRAGGMLCIGCLEKRLGRVLTPADFTDAPINRSGQKSPRLASRLDWRHE